MIQGTLQKLGKRAAGFIPSTFRGSTACPHLEWGLLRVVRVTSLFLKVTQFVVMCYGSPRKRMHPLFPKHLPSELSVGVTTYSQLGKPYDTTGSHVPDALATCVWHSTGCPTHDGGCAVSRRLRQTWEQSTLWSEAHHIISHKHMRGEKAMSMCFGFVLREWVVDNYQCNNEAALTMRLKIPTDICRCASCFCCLWGTPLQARCAEMNLTRWLSPRHHQIRPLLHGPLGQHRPPQPGTSSALLTPFQWSFTKACSPQVIPNIWAVYSHDSWVTR
jgi:hypothetical protein